MPISLLCRQDRGRSPFSLVRRGERGLLSRHNPDCERGLPRQIPLSNGGDNDGWSRDVETSHHDLPARLPCPPNNVPCPERPPNPKSGRYRARHAPARLPGDPLIMPKSRTPAPPPPAETCPISA
jgi:hypothetical protein